MGAIAEGTATVVARRSNLDEYPLSISAAGEHVTALSDALALFGKNARLGIAAKTDLDAAAADILTEISRGIDKWLWFVESHENRPPSHQ